MNTEQSRLEEARMSIALWIKRGPYLSDAFSVFSLTLPWSEYRGRLRLAANRFGRVHTENACRSLRQKFRRLPSQLLQNVRKQSGRKVNAFITMGTMS